MLLKYSRRRGAAATLALAGSLVLAGCTGSGGGAASSAATSTSSTSSSTSTSATSSTTATTSTKASPTSSTTTGAATKTSTTSASTSTTAKPTASPALLNACVNANSRANSAVTTWNDAVKSQQDSQLDKAADNFRAAATYLRSLTKEPGDKEFTPLVWKVAQDFDDMADARKQRQTVSTATYNADAQKMRQFCTSRLTA